MSFDNSRTNGEDMASKNNLSPPVAWAAVRSKAAVELLLIHCLFLLPLFYVGVFGPCFVVQCFNSILFSFAIISLVALYFNRPFDWCPVNVGVLCLFLAVPWAGLQCVIVSFSGHTHLLFIPAG